MASGLDRFNMDVFEKALPVNRHTNTRMWVYSGIVHNEHTYVMHPTSYCRVVVWSTIMSDKGETYLATNRRIRGTLEVAIPQKSGTLWLPVRDAPSITEVDRKSGWEARMVDMLRVLWRAGSQIVQPLVIGDTVGFASTAVNKMRPYASNKNVKPSFRWLDQCPGARLKYVNEPGKTGMKFTEDFRAQLLHYNIMQEAANVQERVTHDINSA